MIDHPEGVEPDLFRTACQCERLPPATPLSDPAFNLGQKQTHFEWPLRQLVHLVVLAYARDLNQDVGRSHCTVSRAIVKASVISIDDQAAVRRIVARRAEGVILCDLWRR